MTTLVIPDTLAERLRHVAQQENRPLEDVLASLLEYMRAKQMLLQQWMACSMTMCLIYPLQFAIQ